MKSSWKTYVFIVNLIIVGGLFMYLTYETYKADNMGFETKTYWDWMELLIIPIVLAIGAFALDRSERAIERQRADDREKLDRKIATDRQQAATLQAYIEKLGELLLLMGDLKTADKDKVRDIAKIQTISVIRVLDSARNDLVIQFLLEANLINEKGSILNNANLENVDLSKVHWRGFNMQESKFQGANFQGADLENMNLQRANFSNANLENTNLTYANLQDAILLDTNLQHAKLGNANLRGSDLRYSNFEEVHLLGADLENANLQGAKNVPIEQLINVKSLKGVNLQNADFRGKYLSFLNLHDAKIQDADFRDAQLRYVNLQNVDARNADFQGANLEGANLVGANLLNAKITDEQLAQAKSLKGAIMPDGTRHE